MNKRLFIISCAPVCIAVMWLVAKQVNFYFELPESDDAVSRLSFVIKWLMVPGSCLLIGIMTMACQRLVSGKGISGTRYPEWHSMEVNIRYNQNTLEQTVLAAIAWLCLCLELKFADLWLIGLFAMFFGVGRLLFWIGYLKEGHEELRAPGMLLTLLPTAGSFLWLAYMYGLRYSA